MTERLSFKKKVIFYIILLCIVFISIETVSRVIYYRISIKYPLACYQAYLYAHKNLKKKIIKKSYEGIKGLYSDDSLLGYRFVPGVHKLSIEYKNIFSKKIWEWTAHVNNDGHRETSVNPNQYIGKPEIWIFGDSYTWGWLLNNKDTFPWLLQNKLENFRILNLGGLGYSNIHALLQLKNRINKSEECPKIGIFIYNPFHIDRNVALLPNDLIHNTLSQYQYPQGFFNNEGEIDIRMVPIQYENSNSEPDILYRRIITIMIFMEIKKICDNNNIFPVIAFQSGIREDPILLFCDTIGYTIIDISIELSPKYIVVPFDNYPNQDAHHIYFQKLFEGIKKISFVASRNSN